MSNVTIAKKYLADAGERIVVTFIQAFLAASLMSGVFDTTGVTDTSAWQRAAFGGIVAVLVLIKQGAEQVINLHPSDAWADAGVRIAATFVQVFLAAIIASGLDLGDFADTSLLARAGLAGVAAVLSAFKVAVATYVGKQTGSLLPAKLDPLPALPA